jgi:hypothetical protein
MPELWPRPSPANTAAGGFDNRLLPPQVRLSMPAQSIQRGQAYPQRLAACHVDKQGEIEQ